MKSEADSAKFTLERWMIMHTWDCPSVYGGMWNMRRALFFPGGTWQLFSQRGVHSQGEIGLRVYVAVR